MEKNAEQRIRFAILATQHLWADAAVKATGSAPLRRFAYTRRSSGQKIYPYKRKFFIAPDIGRSRAG
ncbi:hypothetical protein [Burkholderia glumae]|uniref:hypothetical protein n=1 Tax=Burkholderia glumae TaxID=337 RepID=UPI00203695E6|nr:hypothetical protein [Burkholderia glumae]MCM2538726.1 hypothetical protein [Burkholderia glumae]